MKRIVLYTLAAAAFSAAAYSAPFLALGDGAELFVTGTTSVQSNDNIFLSGQNEKSDVIFDFVPGFLVQFGKNSLTKGSFAFNEDFMLYGSQSKLNSNLSNVTFNTKYDDDKTKIGLDASYHQVDQASRDIHANGFLVRRDLTHIAGTGEVALTEKTSVGSGFTYDDTNYKQAGYVDWRWEEVPLNVYYTITPKVDLSAGIRYRDNQLGAGGINSTDYFYNVGARGEFTPKFSGQFSVGYNTQKLSGAGATTGGLGLDSNFTYLATPKTSVVFGASNDYGYSGANGSSMRIFSVYGGVNAAVSEQWTFSGTISYGHYKYISTTQADDFYQAQIGATYVVNAYVNVTGSYAYRDDNSNLAGSSFKNNVFSLSASFKY